MRCVIVIPTYNRAHLLRRAIDAALSQSLADVRVLVVDDGSTDDTAQLCRSYASCERFSMIAVERNLGTARIKNLALALCPFDAITFHDSDDLPDRDKLLIQARTLARTDHRADECLGWHLVGGNVTHGDQVMLDVVLAPHIHVGLDGRRHVYGRALSLVDDFFPNLQFTDSGLGDWVLINSGLYHRRILARIGGYADMIEEDREFRNRLLMHGGKVWFGQEPLMTVIPQQGSLTLAQDSGYRSTRRMQDRTRVWQDIERWRSQGELPVVPIELDDVVIADAINADHLQVADDLPISPATRRNLTAQLRQLKHGEPAPWTKAM
jgi:glycosyltransferase involved in cell wall biosynthesis